MVSFLLTVLIIYLITVFISWISFAIMHNVMQEEPDGELIKIVFSPIFNIIAVIGTLVLGFYDMLSKKYTKQDIVNMFFWYKRKDKK